MVQAANHVVGVSDPQTIDDYAAALGAVQDDRASSVLWDLLTGRNVARGQAVIALTWRHSPADLPKLAQLTFVPANGRSLERELSGSPHASRARLRGRRSPLSGNHARPFGVPVGTNTQHPWADVGGATGRVYLVN